MTIRTSAEDVLNIIDVDSSVDVQPFMEAANVIVDANLTDVGLSDSVLEQIEKWLTAHLLTAINPRTRSEMADGLQITYETPSFIYGGMKESRYGRFALMLDSSGTLAALGVRKAVIGTMDITLEE